MGMRRFIILIDDMGMVMVIELILILWLVVLVLYSLISPLLWLCPRCSLLSFISVKTLELRLSHLSFRVRMYMIHGYMYSSYPAGLKVMFLGFVLSK
jgi:hypothetical protein